MAGGAAVLAVCGGYQLLGAFYRDVSGAEQPGAGLLPLYTVAGQTRMIGDCLIECELEPGVSGRRSPGSRTTRGAPISRRAPSRSDA